MSKERLDKGVAWRDREKEPGQVARLTTLASMQPDRGCMIPLIPHTPLHTHAWEPYTPYDKPFAINKLVLMSAECKMRPTVFAVRLCQVDWQAVTQSMLYRVPQVAKEHWLLFYRFTGCMWCLFPHYSAFRQLRQKWRPQADICMAVITGPHRWQDGWKEMTEWQDPVVFPQQRLTITMTRYFEI